MSEARVAVIVPAFNAERTVGQTLSSIRAQTYGNLEIIVVDDGSSDRTVETIAAHQRHDGRIRVISQSNAGVAAARNAGARASGSPLLAFVDADDLWKPSKIERQVNVISASPHAGLVYAWFAPIDECGRQYPTWNQAQCSGPALGALCRGNFIGNGSSVLVTREVFETCGGFDPSLRARGAQGCEDLKFYLAVAERFDFAVVPEFLVGYRRRRGAMSSDGLQMLRSFDLVADEYKRRYPQYAADLDAHRADLAYLFSMRTASEGGLRQSWRLLSERPGPRPLSSGHLRATCLFILAAVSSLPRARLRLRTLPRRRARFLEPAAKGSCSTRADNSESREGRWMPSRPS